MKTLKIDTLFNEINNLLSELSQVSSKNGIHLDNDLESAVFELLLDENLNEMTLLKHRMVTAIGQIKSGTFKIKDIESIESRKVA